MASEIEYSAGFGRDLGGSGVTPEKGRDDAGAAIAAEKVFILNTFSSDIQNSVVRIHWADVVPPAGYFYPTIRPCF